MLSPLRIGGTELPVPVVLAPMAGVTNRAFRRMCREYGAGLYVSEMVTSRALVERNAETLAMCAFGDEESPRSIQLYGVDPDVMGRAVRMVADDDMADHIDLNMGCPVPKVTRKGGGAALPWKLDLFRSIVRAAVRNADGRPVTVKMRKGIDDEHLTYRDAARIAADEGVEWVALHARTAQQMYSGQADWEAIGNLVQDLYPLPVLGNDSVTGRRYRTPRWRRCARCCGSTPGCWWRPSVSTRGARRSASTSPGTSRATRCVSICASSWRM